MEYAFLHFLPNIIYNSTIFSVRRTENVASVLCIVHKKHSASLVIVNKFDRLSKNDIFLKDIRKAEQNHEKSADFRIDFSHRLVYHIYGFFKINKRGKQKHGQQDKILRASGHIEPNHPFDLRCGASNLFN